MLRIIWILFYSNNISIVQVLPKVYNDPKSAILHLTYAFF